MPHIHEQYDYTASGVIVHGEKTLLIKHKNLGFWVAPSGHVELDQTPIEALYAEIKEEAGITAEHLSLVSISNHNLDFPRRADSQALPLPFDMEVHPIGDSGHKHIDLAYLLTSDTAEVTPGESESQEWQWMSKETLKQTPNMPEGVRARGLFAIEHVRSIDGSL